jgi:hypothetical protein
MIVDSFGHIGSTIADSIASDSVSDGYINDKKDDDGYMKDKLSCKT